MMRSLCFLIAILTSGSLVSCIRAQTPPVDYPASICKVAPVINGLEDGREWKTAARSEITFFMISAQGQARTERKGELLLMNSAGNLYVALRLPDDALDNSFTPLKTDMAALAFCRGDELTEGDDRRIVLPGLFADKHFVTPGRDADDSQQNGKAAMGWKKTAAGGEHFIEWQVPLNASDKNDISGKPGQRLRFNLAFIDRFSAGMGEAEIGSLFGDMDNAKTWGTLQLAENAGAETAAPPPAWAAKYFPNSGKPGQLKNRLRLIEATEKVFDGRLTGSALVEFTYPGLDERDEVGQARIALPPEILTGSKPAAPLLHIAGYELDEIGCAAMAAKGYVVTTPHGSTLNPLSRGVNLDAAILHAARQLACVDVLKVSIQGGSAGGWMTLMLAADTFPLVCALPDVPPIHWGYNGAYIDESRAMAAGLNANGQPSMPVLLAVGDIAATSKTHYGMPWDSPALLAVSPLAHLDTITAPTLTIFSTADMLVPIDQVSPDLVKPMDASLFPAGFSTAMTERFPGVKGRRTLLKALQPSQYQLFPLPRDPQPAGFVSESGSPLPAKPLELPFNKSKVWSIVVIDEGAVEPGVGHYKYNWAPNHEPFRKWAEAQGISAAQLTAPKLERLMKRLKGIPWRPIEVRPGGVGEPRPGTQLDYPEAERADVLRGLQAFARDDKRALHLARVYSGLPANLKTLGTWLGTGTAASVRAALQMAAK